MNEKQLQELKDKIEKGKMTKYKAETRLEELEKQEKTLKEEIISLGYDPEKLDEIISKLENEKQDLISKINEMLPDTIPNI
ncbi:MULTISPECIES: hypothetical protein [Tepidibacter]|jgi:Holliday junction resolvasome RuvABC DNA-binding subunit|uniref:hypothetical protein n=1 Tax=Tepidibacter TaxID=214904 RepID=UPI0020C128DD|nr:MULTISPECIES: hypothetical protein [Tepidibacter]MCT4509483.1 hypothetical protein [Tepidibacter sp.]CAH2215111.1 conserved protein of unknown function [Tepidibacter aestuarii]